MSRLKLGALLVASLTLPTACGSGSGGGYGTGSGGGYGSMNTGSTGCTASSATQTTSVSMVDMSFSPACIKVTSGQTVTWTNNSSLTHTVTTDSGAPVSFDSGNLGAGGTFSYTFTSAGTVPYHCTLHVAYGMRGTVIVE